MAATRATLCNMAQLRASCAIKVVMIRENRGSSDHPDPLSAWRCKPWIMGATPRPSCLSIAEIFPALNRAATASHPANPSK